jgi:hypothetical protein
LMRLDKCRCGKIDPKAIFSRGRIAWVTKYGNNGFC